MNSHISQESTSVSDSKYDFNTYSFPLTKTSFYYDIKNQSYSLDIDIKMIKHLKHILSKSPVISISKNREHFKLPPSITKESFENFIYFLTKDQRFPDYTHLSSIINIFLILELYDSFEEIVKNKIIPFIVKENCIDILKCFNSLNITQNIVQSVQNIIIIETSNTIAKNILYILRHKKQQLMELPIEDIENIIEYYIRLKSSYNGEEINEVINFLYEIRNVNNYDFFSLLDNELRRILPGKHEEGLYQSNSNDDVIIKLDIDFSNGIPFINVEEETIIERNGIDIKIITNYNKNDDSLILAFQINNYEKEIMNSSIGVPTQENNLFLNSTINEFDNSEYENSMFLGFISFIEINSHDIKFKSPLNFQCLNRNTKNKILLFPIKNITKDLTPNKNYNIELKIHLERIFTYPFYLGYFCENKLETFDNSNQYSLTKLPKKILQLILSYNSNSKNLEQNKLKLLILWIYKNKLQSQIDSYLYLFELINFDDLSPEIIINMLMYCNDILLSSKHLMEILITKIAIRLRMENISESIRDKFSKKDEINMSYYGNNNSDSILVSSVNLTDNFKLFKEDTYPKAKATFQTTNNFLSHFILSIVSHCSKNKLNLFKSPNIIMFNTESLNSTSFKVNATDENNTQHVNNSNKKIKNRNLSSPILTNNEQNNLKHNKSNSLILHNTKENAYNFPCKIPNCKKIIPNSKSKRTLNNNHNNSNSNNNNNNIQNNQNESNNLLSNPSSKTHNTSTFTKTNVNNPNQKSKVNFLESKTNFFQTRSPTPDVFNIIMKKQPGNKNKVHSSKPSKNSSIDYKSCALNSMRYDNKKLQLNYKTAYSKIQHSSPINGNNFIYNSNGKGVCSFVSFRADNDIKNFIRANIGSVVSNSKITKCNSVVSVSNFKSETPHMKRINEECF